MMYSTKDPVKYSNSSFTLIELIIVLAIIASLVGVLIAIIKPQKIFENLRDTRRIADLNNIDKALSLIISSYPRFNELTYASSNTVYISLPDTSSNCASYQSQLPPLPSGWSYRCSANPQNIDGTGWIPIPFNQFPLINISSLPIDPINKPPYYYSFVAGGSYEITAALEKNKTVYIVGTKQGLTPFAILERLTGRGWLYRRPITISNSTSSLTDYQVLVTLDTQSLISANKMRSDCGDIRFTDSDGSTQLSYWLESGCNSANTKIWVKVPFIPTGNKTIYVYYGNPEATSMSNGDATFEFFDDFEGNTINAYKWDTSNSGGYFSILSGKLYYNGLSGGFGPRIRALKNGTNFLFSDYIVEFLIITTSGYGELGIMYRGSIPETANTYHFHPTSINYVFRITKRVNNASYYVTNTNTGTFSFNVWYKVRIVIVGNSHNAEITNINTGQTLNISGTDASFITGTFGVMAWGNAVAYVDDLRIRKYASPEPTTSIGAEESIQP